MLRCQLVNPIHLDPGLLLSLPQSSEKWLLDCGDLHPLSLQQLQQISTVFLSHAHIDHWIGLDALLRAQLFGLRPLRILGPSGLHTMLAGRLQGYAWNLVSRSQFSIQAFEWTGQQWSSCIFECAQSFRPKAGPAKLPDFEGWSLKWVELNHGVACLGYRLESPQRYRFDPACPHPPGPWIEELKTALTLRQPERVVQVGSQSLPAADLKNWLSPIPTYQVGYITDTRLDDPTRRDIQNSFGPTRQLWCEAAFVQSQQDLAVAKKHATAREAAQLAVELSAERLNLFHLSRRSQGQADEHLREAREIFPNTWTDREVFA